MDSNNEDILDIQTSKNEVTISNGEYYQILDKSAPIKNATTKCRMYVNLLSAVAAEKILNNYDFKTNIEFGLHMIPSIISKWDIAEVFINGCRISVRAIFDDYKLFIPKKHEKYGLFPDLFMFLEINNNSAKLLGFLPKENINKINSDDTNYYIELNELKTLDDIKNFIEIPLQEENIEELKKERKKIIQYTQGKIEDKIEFFNLIANSPYLRKELIKFENANMYYTKIIEHKIKIEEEIQKDIVNISKLADAFIQSKNEILKSTENRNIETAENFKLECARANFEKLFSMPNITEDVENRSSQNIENDIFKPSNFAVDEENRLPISAVLNAFKLFVFLILIILLVMGWYCYSDYSNIGISDILLTLKTYAIKIKTLILH